MTTLKDILSSSFLENVTSVSIPDMVIALLLAFGLGLFIFLVYKKTYNGVMYSASFGTALIAMTMITTLVILAVTSNVVLSLGMVGALSIVRFRAAIKEPLDITFLFWSITVGIVLAAGFLPLAVFGSVLLAAYLKRHTDTCIIKSKTAAQGVLELNYEIRLKTNNTDFINDIAAMTGVSSAVLVSYNGDYMG